MSETEKYILEIVLEHLNVCEKRPSYRMGKNNKV